MGSLLREQRRPFSFYIIYTVICINYTLSVKALSAEHEKIRYR
jgi:hypothetical protein